MKLIAVTLLLILAACMQTAEETVTTGDTPPDFCMQDNDCVRQPNCCDCGVGTWVNKEHQVEAPAQCAEECKCALQRAVGVCQNNRCVGELV